MSEPYRFPGIADFVKRDGLNPTFAAKIPGLWFVARVADALAQIPTAKPEHRADMYGSARQAIAALHSALGTAVAAFDQVMANCPPLADPDDPPIPQIDPFTLTREPVADPAPVSDEDPKPKSRVKS